MLTEKEIIQLVNAAKIARENAFVPRSNHKIGASILTTDGNVFSGCNIESNISGLGTCAERTAIDTAITQGKYEFKALVTIDDGEAIPCGACLQYLLEFYVITEVDIEILTATTKGEFKTYSLLGLLPHHYLPHHDVDKIKRYKNK